MQFRLAPHPRFPSAFGGLPPARGDHHTRAAHVAVARDLGLPLPGPGESVSARVTPAERAGPGVAEIGGNFWKLAKPGDPIIPAPVLPEV